MTAEGLIAATACFAFAIVDSARIVGGVVAITAGGWLIALGVTVIAAVFVGIFLLMATALS